MKLVFQAWRLAFNFGVSKLAKLARTLQYQGFHAP
jgi:hypothetical protein